MSDKIQDKLDIFFGKIGDLLDIFNLSFLISGFACMGALMLWMDVHVEDVTDLSGSIVIGGGVIVSYILGMFCFAIGRGLRQWFCYSIFRRKRYSQLIQIFDYHQVKDLPWLHDYLDISTINEKDKVKKLGFLYSRIWTEVRQIPELAPSYSHLNRFWVLAATYDGFIAALLVWSILIIKLKAYWFLWGTGVLILASGREAWRYEIYQTEELVSTLAHYVAGDPNKGSIKSAQKQVAPTEEDGN